MRISFTTIYDVPDHFAEEFVMGLRAGMAPLMDPDILKKGTQTITIDGEFRRPQEPDKPIKIPIITVIETGSLQ